MKQRKTNWLYGVVDEALDIQYQVVLFEFPYILKRCKKENTLAESLTPSVPLMCQFDFIFLFFRKKHTRGTLEKQKSLSVPLH